MKQESKTSQPSVITPVTSIEAGKRFNIEELSDGTKRIVRIGKNISNETSTKEILDVSEGNYSWVNATNRKQAIEAIDTYLPWLANGEEPYANIGGKLYETKVYFQKLNPDEPFPYKLDEEFQKGSEGNYTEMLYGLPTEIRHRNIVCIVFVNGPLDKEILSETELDPNLGRYFFISSNVIENYGLVVIQSVSRVPVPAYALIANEAKFYENNDHLPVAERVKAKQSLIRTVVLCKSIIEGFTKCETYGNTFVTNMMTSFKERLFQLMFDNHKGSVNFYGAEHSYFRLVFPELVNFEGYLEDNTDGFYRIAALYYGKERVEEIRSNYRLNKKAAKLKNGSPSQLKKVR